MRKIVVGVGNPLLGNDGVGIAVADMLQDISDDISSDIKIEKSMAGGIEICEMISGYDLAIIIDAYRGERNGNVKEISIDEYEGRVNHDVNFINAYNILKKYFKMPEVKIIGIEVSDIDYGEISEEVKKAIPNVIEKIKKILEDENACRKG
ncbi:MAG: hydrogenase maturation protease [Thermoplasmatales archaeon]|nr:hydrogenase maturation protease [Thermoplasmatales archaeon]